MQQESPTYAFGKEVAKFTLTIWNLLPDANRCAIKQKLPIHRGVIGVISYVTGWLMTTLSEDNKSVKIGEFSQGFGGELILDYVQDQLVRNVAFQENLYK